MQNSQPSIYNENVLSIKYLLRITLLLSATFLVLLLSSCRGSVGPQGSDATRDGYTEFKTIEFTIEPNNWSLVSGTTNNWSYMYSTTALTEEVELKGMVLLYMKSANKQTWQLLPYTFMSRETNGSYYSTEYSAWWGVGQMEIQYTDTHPTTPLKPDFNVTIKAVICRDVYPLLLQQKENYDKVISTIDNLTPKDRLDKMK